jgi:hypothetical protein
MVNSAAVVSSVPAGVQMICRLAGAAAIACSFIVLGGVVAVLIRGLQGNFANGDLGTLGNNWLVTLFRLHFGVDGLTNELLHGIRLIDMLILALTAATGIGLWFALKSTSSIWSVVGMALPFVGIILYILTQLAGRSAVMAAVLAFAVIAFWSPGFGRIAPCIGLLAGALLLLGDLTEPLHSKVIAWIIAAGYVLLAVWFVLVGIRMVQIK